MNARRLTTLALGLGGMATTAFAQVPDLVNALDAGGRSMGAGGAFNGTTADVLSAYHNPAGLAFVDRPSVGFGLRNLPKSVTTISGDTNDPFYNTSGKRGNQTIGHAGYIMPLGNGKRGVLGFTYNIGGYLDDQLSGQTSAGSVTTNKSLNRKLRTDYFTIAFAKAKADQSFSWGIGLQVASDSLSYKLQQNDSLGGSITRDDSETGIGVGGIIGFQFTPKSNPNVSIGASYRSEIDLNSNPKTKDLYDKIPARLLAAIAYRRDGIRGGKDFIVFGGDVTHFFNARAGIDFQRKNQTTAGVGFEYNYGLSGARIPVRVGYNIVPGGGTGFGSRNAFTFGLGYRPSNNRFAIDLNFASPENGGYDMSLSLNYRFGK